MTSTKTKTPVICGGLRRTSQSTFSVSRPGIMTTTPVTHPPRGQVRLHMKASLGPAPNNCTTTKAMHAFRFISPLRTDDDLVS